LAHSFTVAPVVKTTLNNINMQSTILH
jgi:hypothetical protein